MTSFCEIIGKDARLEALKQIKGCLAAEGVLIITLHNPRPKRATMEQQMLQVPLSSDPVLAAEGLRCLGTFNGVEVLTKWAITPDGTAAFGIQRYLDKNNGKDVSLPMKFDLVSEEEFRSASISSGLFIKETWGDYNLAKYDRSTSSLMIFSLCLKLS